MGKLSVLLLIFLFGSLLPSMCVGLPGIGFWIKSVFTNGETVGSCWLISEPFLIPILLSPWLIPIENVSHCKQLTSDSFTVHYCALETIIWE